MEGLDLSKGYTRHGIFFTQNKGKERVARCIFCEKDNHFSVNRLTGQCQCLRRQCCNGNIYTFLRQLHELFLPLTEKDDYLALKRRFPGLSWLQLRKHGWALNRLTDQWFFPVYKREDAKTKLVNMMFIDESTGKVLSTDGCKRWFYGLESLKTEGPIYFTEGEKDKVAMEWLLEEAGHEQPYSVLGMPGAGIFPIEQLNNSLSHRPIVFFLDHDEAGRKGTQAAVTKITNSTYKPTSIKTVRWFDTLDEGYDVRDFVNDNHKKPKSGWKHLQEIIIDYDESGLKRIKRHLRESFKEVVGDFKRAGIHVDRGFRDALAVSCATTFSVRIPGDPIWMLIVAPAGSGKTTLLEAFLGSDEYCYGISKFTSQTLVSGWRDNDGKDASLLPTLNGRTVVIKDYTTIKRLPTSVQEELYGLLRDVYDGHTHIRFGNREDKQYENIHFAILAGVTNIIHGDNQATCGERFMKIELLEDDHNHEEHIRAAIRGSGEKDERIDTLRRSILGFLDRQYSKDELPKTPLWVEDRIVALSQIIGFLRAEVERDKQGLKYRPESELGTRAAVQLSRLAECLAFVFGVKEVDKQCMRIVEKVALDSVIEFNLEIVQALAVAKHPLTPQTLEKKLRLSLPTIRRNMENLRELKVVDFESTSNNKHGGKNSRLWTLDPHIQDLWNRAFKSDEAKILRRKRKRILI